MRIAEACLLPARRLRRLTTCGPRPGPVGCGDVGRRRVGGDAAMSAFAASASRHNGGRVRFPSLADARAGLVAGSVRAAQVVLGLIWVIDGGLQFQPFMYSHGWVQQLSSAEAGQPQWLAASIDWGAGLAGANLPV